MVLTHFLLTLLFSGLQQKLFQIAMWSSCTVGGFRQVIKDQVSKYIAVALAIASNLTEKAQWEFTIKQVFIIFIPVALRAPR